MPGSPRKLHDAVVALAQRKGWTTTEAIVRETGVARSTLDRWSDDAGSGRGDALAKLEKALDLPAGVLARVRDGELDIEDLLEEAGSVSFRSGGESLHDPATDSSAFLQQAFERLAEDRAAHGYALEELLQEQVRVGGIRPELPGPDEPGYDLAWALPDGRRAVAEVKVAGASSDRVWQAMGQLLVYVDELSGETVPVVVIEREPTDEERQHLEKRGVRVAWPGDWAGLGLDQEKQPAGRMTSARPNGGTHG